MNLILKLLNIAISWEQIREIKHKMHLHSILMHMHVKRAQIPVRIKLHLECSVGWGVIKPFLIAKFDCILLSIFTDL